MADDAGGALTAERVTAALRAAGTIGADVAVSGLEQTPVGTGQMAGCIRLGVTYDAATEAPARMVAKVPAADATSRGAGAAGAYDVEVRFYQELAGALPIRTPRCYGLEAAAPGGEFLLLLEDLAPAEQGDQLAGCSPEAAELAVVEAAKLHGPTWGRSALKEQHPWLDRQMVGTGGVGMGEIMGMFHPQFCARYADRLDPEVVAMGERIVPRIEEYYAKAQPSSVVHGDYRLDNLLFGTPAGGPPIAVVDWQTHYWGDPLLDLSYFIGAGLKADDRHAHERSLVEAYRTSLAGHGVELGADEVWERYRLHALSGWHMAIFASMVVVQTDRGDEMFCTMANRHGRQALDLETESLF